MSRLLANYVSHEFIRRTARYDLHGRFIASRRAARTSDPPKALNGRFGPENRFLRVRYRLKYRYPERSGKNCTPKTSCPMRVSALRIRMNF